MKKTLLLALALTSVSLAGCAEEGAETDAVIVDETAAPMTEPADDMMMEDTTAMMDGSMEAAPAGGTMEGAAPAGGTMEGAAPAGGMEAAPATADTTAGM